MGSNLKELADELLQDIKNLEGFSSPLIEEELVNNLAEKIHNRMEGKDDIKQGLIDMFALGQIFKSTENGK